MPAAYVRFQPGSNRLPKTPGCIYGCRVHTCQSLSLSSFPRFEWRACRTEGAPLWRDAATCAGHIVLRRPYGVWGGKPNRAGPGRIGKHVGWMGQDQMGWGWDAGIAVLALRPPLRHGHTRRHARGKAMMCVVALPLCCVAVPCLGLWVTLSASRGTL